jgi:hypothetical protein
LRLIIELKDLFVKNKEIESWKMKINNFMMFSYVCILIKFYLVLFKFTIYYNLAKKWKHIFQTIKYA